MHMVTNCTVGATLLWVARLCVVVDEGSVGTNGPSAGASGVVAVAVETWDDHSVVVARITDALRCELQPMDGLCGESQSCDKADAGDLVAREVSLQTSAAWWLAELNLAGMVDAALVFLWAVRGCGRHLSSSLHGQLRSRTTVRI